MHFRISSSLSFQRKTKRHVFLLLFVLTPVHLNWPSYATGKCYRSPLQLISTMKHWWLYINIHSFTIFLWKMRNLRLNLMYLSLFVQYRCENLDTLSCHIPPPPGGFCKGIFFWKPIKMLQYEPCKHSCGWGVKDFCGKTWGNYAKMTENRK